jgi:dTDP-glucose pyrophosphorylase
MGEGKSRDSVLCVIPAAGLGIRFNDLGRRYPKAILPNEGLPILVSNIRRVLDTYPNSQVAVVVGHQSKKIVDCLESYLDAELMSQQIVIIETDPESIPSGPAISISEAVLRFPQHDAVLVVLGDILLSASASLTSKDSYISASVRPDWQRWCMVEGVEGIATKLIDKPNARPDTDLALSGTYFFSDAGELRQILNEMSEQPRDIGEYQISQFLGPYISRVTTRIRTDVGVTDFGTLGDFIQNRSVLQHRSFNRISEVSPNVIQKTCTQSDQSQKIMEEISWYLSLPPAVKAFCPNLISWSSGENSNEKFPSYQLEKIQYPTLREYLLYLESGVGFWHLVIERLFELLEVFRVSSPPCSSQFFQSYETKFRSRIKGLPTHLSIPPHVVDGLMSVVVESESLISERFKDSLFHGDLTLSNIFCEPHSHRLKIIDPLGKLFGNVLYDIAKWAQCFCYGYDFVDMELYRNTPDSRTPILYDDNLGAIAELFQSEIKNRLGVDISNFVHFLCGLQFIALIPLHSHSVNNQKIYFELGMRALRQSTIAPPELACI